MDVIAIDTKHKLINISKTDIPKPAKTYLFNPYVTDFIPSDSRTHTTLTGGNNKYYVKYLNAKKEIL
jgi:hypothetical protein